MSTKEIKTEINNVINSVPENLLEDILEYLRFIQNSTEDQFKTSKNLKKILEEDKQLLDRLAQ